MAEPGIALTPLSRTFSSMASNTKRFQSSSTARPDRHHVCAGPTAPPPASADAMVALGAEFWPLKLARELDDAILNIRLNEFDVAAIVFKSSGDPGRCHGV